MILFWKLWNGNEVQGQNKLKSIQGLEDFFKEYKIRTVLKDIKRIEALLKVDVRCSANPEEINTYKVLENQQNNLMKAEEVI